MEDYSLEKSLSIWEYNAEHWDDYMGDMSNDFHRNVVRPKVTELLDIKEGDLILDISCGNGNYSAFMAEHGAKVVAFDYSTKMIERAKKRRSHLLDRIEFTVADATNEQQLMSLQKAGGYTKAVSNMAVMDITEIDPLFSCVNRLLSDNGSFVFFYPASVFHNTDRQIPYPTCLLRHRDTGAASGALLLSQIVAGYFQRLSEKRICHRRVL